MPRFIVFIEDDAIQSDIVLSVTAELPRDAHKAVEAYYQREGWDNTIKHVRTVRLDEKKDVQNVGKTRMSVSASYQKDMQTLCEKLFEVAQSILNDEGNTAYFDRLIAFLKSFPVGAQVVNAYYGETQ